MSLYADALDLLTHWQAPDDAQEQLRSAYVAHLHAHPDGLQRSCLPEHVTAGALVISPDLDQVLLNLHRKSGRWFHFGGHLEAGDATLAGGALRETTEESGLRGLMARAEPVQLSRHPVAFCAPGQVVHHLDVRFVATAERAEVPVVSEESLDVRWWPLDALPTQDPDMLQLIALALRRQL